MNGNAFCIGKGFPSGTFLILRAHPRSVGQGVRPGYLDEVFSLLLCFKETWGRVLAFYTLVFQAYLEVFLETRFSQFVGFGHANLGGHC